MSKDGRSPLIRLALPSFRSSFGDLLNTQSLYSFYTRSILESVYEQIMWFGRTRDDYINFERTTRSSYYFLEQGYQADEERVAKQLIEAQDKIVPALNAVLTSKIDAEKSPNEDPDKKIVEYLQYYKILYERLLPVICAPIVYAFNVYRNIDDPIFIPRDDGQIDLNAIQKMNRHLAYSVNRLSIGLNNHVRNAFSHEYYTVLDDAQIRLWDINPRTGDYSWGPEVWPLDQLVSLCDQLFVNCLGITCSILIYYMNYPDIISRLDFSSRPEPYHLRRRELDHLLHTITDELGFYLKDFVASTNQFSLTLSLKTKGIDQDSKLYLGYAKYVQLIKIPIWYEETRVIDQLIMMLYLLAPYFAIQTQISINIIADDNSSLGELLTDFDTIVSLKLTNADPKIIDQNRHRFQRDTINNLSTYIEKQGEPRYIGRAPTNDDA